MPRFKGVAFLVALVILSMSPAFAGPDHIAQLVITVIDASNDPILGPIVGLSEQAPLLNTPPTNVELAKRTLRCDNRGECSNNDLGRPSFATVSASIKYSRNHTDLVLAGGNLTNVYAGKFTLIGAGVPYPGLIGQIPTDAYSLQARSLIGTVTQRW